MEINTPERQAEYTNLKIDFAFTASIILLGEFCLRHQVAPGRIVEIWKDHCQKDRAKILTTLPPEVEVALNNDEFAELLEYVAGELRLAIHDAKSMVAEEIFR